MAIKREVLGRITMFHQKEEGINKPVQRGYIEYPDGTKVTVTLWAEQNVNCTKGEILKGQVVKETREED